MSRAAPRTVRTEANGAKPATRPYKSGFCTRGNPTDSHARCPQEYQGRPCLCDCHHSSGLEEAPSGVRAVMVEPVHSGPEVGSLQVVGSENIPDNPHGFHTDVPEAEYHTHAGSLSQSGAKLLLNAPALFRYEQEHPTYKKVWEFGKAAHAEVLGAGAEIVVHEYDPEKVKSPKATSAWKAQHAEVTSRGAVLLLPAEMQQVRDMADALKRHPLAMRLLSDGLPEVSAFAVDDDTKVMRRGRFDWLGKTILSDYKTSTTADPKAFARSAVDFGYDVQAAWYLDLAADIGHPSQAFAFIVQMKEPPYLVEVVELDDLSVERGRRRYRRALQIFADCTESGIWPGYQTDTEFTTVRVPDWALREEGITP